MRVLLAASAACLVACAPARVAPVPVLVPTPTPLACPATPAPTPTPAQLRVTGRVSVPAGVQALNVAGGLVVGAPVRLLDLATGRQLAAGCTYYDGSFALDLHPASRPAVVQVQLVGADGQATMPLLGALQLDPGLEEQTRDVDAGSTAWVALLDELAARQAGRGQVDWADRSPGAVALQLAGMVAGTDATAEESFGELLDTAHIDTATDGRTLRAAIDELLGQLVKE